MALREQLNKPGVGGAIIAVAVVVALVVFFLTGNFGGRPTVMLYYTADDGKTFFQAPAQASPIQYQGQTAYEVVLYQCNGKKFVGYMKRYAESMRKAVDAAYQHRAPVSASGLEVKAPGDGNWTPVASGPPPVPGASVGHTAADIEAVKCPNGSNATQIFADY